LLIAILAEVTATLLLLAAKDWVGAATIAAKIPRLTRGARYLLILFSPYFLFLFSPCLFGVRRLLKVTIGQLWQIDDKLRMRQATFNP
jgi:hypothetical protein